MKKLYTAKRITIFYFSLIAIAIVSIHFSVYKLTTEDLELLYAKNRLAMIKQHADQVLAQVNIAEVPKTEIVTLGDKAKGQGVTLYFNYSLIPEGFPAPKDIKFDSLVELKSAPDGHAYFISRSLVKTMNGSHEAYFVVDNNLYELSEAQLISLHSKQALISFLLLILSLFAVFKISDKLTRPITRLATSLSTRSLDDLSPLSTNEQVHTIEHAKLVSTFNAYQLRVKTAVERERAFNRFASHELRTPLMVMTGAVNILAETNDPQIIAVQTQRLEKVTHQMTEYVETLLTLTKSELKEKASDRLITEQEIQLIVENHSYLISTKPVNYEIKVTPNVYVAMPEPVFHILVGNIIKNAFAYTSEGTVVIELNSNQLTVVDSGKGILKQAHNIADGYGLGLLLVRDICRQYQWQFTIKNNQESCNEHTPTKGCLAKVKF